TPQERQRLLDLGQDLPALWHHPAATPEFKKRILRTVLREIVLTNNAAATEQHLRLHWQGGVHTELRVRRNRPGEHRHVTSDKVLDIIRELSKVCSDSTLAATLNRLGYRTGKGKTWRAHAVNNVRYNHRLPNYTKGTDCLTIEQTAPPLGA